MKCYFAGVGGSTATFTQEFADIACGMSRRLVSYADAMSGYKGHDVPARFWIEREREREVA